MRNLFDTILIALLLILIFILLSVRANVISTQKSVSEIKEQLSNWEMVYEAQDYIEE